MEEECSSETEISTYKICGVRARTTAISINKAFQAQKAEHVIT
jgi:hypothetical protein